MSNPTGKEINEVIKSMFSVSNEDDFIEWVDENRYDLEEVVKTAFGDVKIFNTNKPK